MKFILTDEGRLVPKDGGFEYEYFIKDHLGNNRLTIKENSGNAEVVAENHYYPFGMTLGGQSWQSTNYLENRYLYNGKVVAERKSRPIGKFQDELGLDWYDYGARFYDAQIGRWHSVDTKAYKFYNNGPYNYCSNNPIDRIDPNGEEWIITTWTDKDGNIHYDIYLTAVIINQSDDKKIHKTQLENSIRAQLIKVFENNKNVNFLIDLRTVDKLSDVKGNEHIFNIVNPDHDKLFMFEEKGVKKYAPASGDLPLGNNKSGLNIFISSELARETINAFYDFDNGAGYGGKNGNARSIAHELGHTAGWIHPNYDQANQFDMQQFLSGKIENNQYNLMWDYMTVRDVFKKDYNSAIKITETQLDILYKNFKNGKLNKK